MYRCSKCGTYGVDKCETLHVPHKKEEPVLVTMGHGAVIAVTFLALAGIALVFMAGCSSRPNLTPPPEYRNYSAEEELYPMDAEDRHADHEAYLTAKRLGRE